MPEEHKPIVGQKFLGIFELVSWAALMHAKRWKDSDPSVGARYWKYDESDVSSAMPYGVHPAWCVFSILQEPSQSIDDIRMDGAAALAVHDLLEDTLVTAGEIEATLTRLAAKGILTINISRVLDLVNQMTFSSSDVEQEFIESTSTSYVHLLKLYDKVSSLQDGLWMYDRERGYRVGRVNYVINLAHRVYQKYGNLNAVIMARHISDKLRTSQLGPSDISS